MLWFSIVVLFICLEIYTLLGACIFHFLEEPHERQLKTAAMETHQSFLFNHSCISIEELDQFVEHILTTRSQGVWVTSNTSSQTNWDFFSSFFFATTTVSTIGYGNIAPRTLAGQAYCVFFSCFGIPLCAAFLAYLGQKLRRPMEKICEALAVVKHKFLRKCFGMFVSGVIGFITFALLPAIAFTYVEGWSYGVSVYYSVITLLTIGLGDYVAGMQPVPYRSLYRTLGAVWIVLGLTWVSLFTNQWVADLENTINKKEQKCKNSKLAANKINVTEQATEALKESRELTYS